MCVCVVYIVICVCVCVCVSQLSCVCVCVFQLSCVPPSLVLLNSTSGVSLGLLGDGGCAENPKHYSFMAVLLLVATTMLVQLSHMIKLALMLLVVVATGAVNIYSWRDIYDIYDFIRYLDYRYTLLLQDSVNTLNVVTLRK